MSRPTVQYLIMLLIILLVSFNVQAQPKEERSVQSKIQKLEDNISEVRRDQLNYKIEKDLLKETFSSNYQTINIVLAMILALFTVIGFVGIRDISTLRKEFISELERLNGLSKEFENKVIKIDKEQEKVKTEYIEILKTNEEQNNRIKILEVQEKISAFIKGNNYSRALEYAAVALDLSPDNIVLLSQKAISLWRLNDLAGAAVIYDKLFNLDTTDTGHLLNLLEIYLISNRLDDYESLIRKHVQLIQARPDSEHVLPYLNILKYYQLGDLGKMKEVAKNIAEKCSPGKAKRNKWDYSDVSRYLETKPADEKKDLLMLLINLLHGNLDRDEALKKISDSQ